MNRLKVGDLVQVIAGKDKGKRGKVTKLLKDSRVLVEGLNMVVRHQKPSQLNTEGGRLEKEAPLHVSNVMPIDADSDKPTRVKIVVDDDGNKSRVAKSGAALKQG
ncbi:MAG TPA: 50S ribosomal protein L24 [Polyangiaceae bacterium]|nr:50S ribosomal protein L24 [Polyangiaceae bacterium]